MEEEQKKELLKQGEFKCVKCGYYSPMGSGLEVNKDHNVILCSICNTFAPEDIAKFNSYLSDKVEWQSLETFRSSGTNKSSHNPHKQGMIARSKSGKLMARPPFGYKVKNGDLIADEEASENVRLIFQEFANGSSLNQLARTYGLSVNGVKKILKNFSYLGKIKFDNQINQGSHKPLVSSELFNRVQQRFEKKKVSIEG